MDTYDIVLICLLLCLYECVKYLVRKKTQKLKKELQKQAETTDKGNFAPVTSDFTFGPGVSNDHEKGSDEIETRCVDAQRKRKDKPETGDDDAPQKGSDKTEIEGGDVLWKRGDQYVKGGDEAWNGKGDEADGRRYGADKKRQMTEAKERGENEKYNKFCESVSKDELVGEMKKAKSTTFGLYKYISQSCNKWKRREINVAVTGNSGAGKSSLINALRKLKPCDKGAAKVGVVETTTEGQRYTYPEDKDLALWDLPGIGTQTFTREKYLDDVKISQFDVIIIVTSTRFLENDMWLAKKMLDLGKYLLFVRTKIDTDMMNAERDHPDDFSKEKYTAMIRNNIADNINKGNIPKSDSEIYLVSSPKRDSYDFPALDRALNKMREEMLKIRAEAIRKVLEEHVEKKIKEKLDINKNEFKVRKVASVIYGFLPLPNLETGLGKLTVSSIHQRCLEKFSLDETSLDKISRELCKPKELIKKSLKTCEILILGKETLLELSEEKKFPSTFRKYSKYFLPIIGSFLSAHKTYGTVQECLETICNAAAKDERLLVQWRLDRLEEELCALETRDVLDFRNLCPWHSSDRYSVHFV